MMDFNFALQFIIVAGCMTLSGSPLLPGKKKILKCSKGIDLLPCTLTEQTQEVILNQNMAHHILEVLLPNEWANDLHLKDIVLKSGELPIFDGIMLKHDYIQEEDSRRWEVNYRFSQQNPNIAKLRITVLVKNVTSTDQYWSHWEFLFNGTTYRTKDVMMFKLQKNATPPSDSSTTLASPEDILIETTSSSTESNSFSTGAPDSPCPTPPHNDQVANDIQNGFRDIKIMVIIGWIIMLCTITGNPVLPQKLYKLIKRKFNASQSDSQATRPNPSQRQRHTSECESPNEDDENSELDACLTKERKPTEEMELGSTSQQDEPRPSSFEPDSDLMKKIETRTISFRQDFEMMAQTTQNSKRCSFPIAEEYEDGQEKELDVLKPSDRGSQLDKDSAFLSID
ncbi:uncharacterized protein LOC121432201 [Lytechinus variegatus]|uniref:uncharacterized protein LOC121432201 n=1 Tax=Lytechinus variegatus TaxID=7654 RepID=UPI001BB29810|nr:uncharacterized protein LOC121432201 [Lytechinus variegatus]